MAKILIVEDERGIAENIVYALETDGFATRWVKTGSEAIELTSKDPIDLIILDVGLPDVSGFEVCRKIRESSSVPIFFLTARAEEVDRVLGLELGADDYIVKPFSPRELSARIRSMLRRMSVIESENAGEEKTFGPFAVDDSRFQISFHGENLQLRRYEFGIIKMMMARPGWVFSRAQIMNEVWESPDMSLERTVDTHIKSIRQKLNKIRETEEWIQTHRGIGYSFKEIK